MEKFHPHRPTWIIAATTGYRVVVYMLLMALWILMLDGLFPVRISFHL